MNFSNIASEEATPMAIIFLTFLKSVPDKLALKLSTS